VTISKSLLAATLVLAIFGPAASVAQEQPITAHFDVVREGGKRKSKDSSNVVIWLTPANGAAAPKPVSQHIPRLVQKNKAFSPHLLVVPVGSAVEFPNRDPFFHNVFSLFEGKRFDLGLYEAGSSRIVHFDRAGISYVFCNIHPEMSAVIVVVDTPYYGVSNAAGDVSIADVPAGSYVMHVWSQNSSPEQLQALTRHVTVSETARTLGSLRLPEAPGLPLAHNNKYDQPYETPSPSSPIYVQP
jgi:plastocyanin